MDISEQHANMKDSPSQTVMLSQCSDALMKRCSLTKGALAGTFCHTSSNALVAKFDTLVWHAKGHTICLRVGDSHPVSIIFHDCIILLCL